MAQVPVYDGPQIRTQALQPVFQSTPDVSSGLQQLGRGLEQVGQGIETVVTREAEAEANRIDNEITSGWLKWNSEAQRKPEYRGQGIDKYEADAAKWWEDTRQKYGSDLSPIVRRQIGPALARKRASAYASVTDYATREKDRFADEQAEAAAQSAIEFGVDSGDTAGASERVKQITAEKGARKGWTTEMVQAEQQRLLGTLHLTQIERLAENDAAAAQAYYDANKAEMPASSQSRVETLIKGNADDQFATSEAARLAGLPLSQQLAEASKVADPERKKKLITEIKSNYALVEGAKREAEDAAAQEAWQMFSTGQKVPESVLSRMDGKERFALQEKQRERADRLASGTTVKTNPAVYLDVRERIARGEQVDLNRYTETLGLTELKELRNLQQPGNQDSVISDAQRVDAALIGLGIDKRRDPEAAVTAMNEIDRRIRLESASKGNRPLSPEEKQKVIDRVMLDKVYVPRAFGDAEVPVAMLTPEQQAEAYVTVDGRDVLLSAVPASDRAEIIRERRKRGLPITEADIVRAYITVNKK